MPPAFDPKVLRATITAVASRLGLNDPERPSQTELDAAVVKLLNEGSDPVLVDELGGTLWLGAARVMLELAANAKDGG